MEKSTIRKATEPVAKFLIKHWLGDFGSAIIEGAVSALDDRSAASDARSVESGNYNEIVERVLTDITTTFAELKVERGEDLEAVCLELAETLKTSGLDLEVLLSSNLDATKITSRLRECRDLATVGLTELQASIYARSIPLLASRIVDLAPKLHKWETKVSREILSRFDSLSMQIQSLRDKPVDGAGTISSKSDTQEGTTRVEATIDNAKDLLKSGQARTALKLLQKLRETTDEQALSSHLRFRLAGNIGSCHFELGNPDIAAVEYQKAYRLQPDNPRAIALGAIASQILGNHHDVETLSRRGLQLHPGNADLTALLIQSLFSLGRVSEVEEILRTELWLFSESVCCFAIADEYRRLGDLDRAEHFFEVALNLDAANPIGYLRYGTVVMRRIQAEMQSDAPLPWRIAPEVLARQRKALAAFERAMELTEEYQNRALYNDALANRAAALFTIKGFAEAERDLKRVLADEPDNHSALFNMGLGLFMDGRYDEAIEYLGSVSSKTSGLRETLTLGECLIRGNQPERARDVLEQIWTPDDSSPDQIAIADCLLRLYFALGESTAITSVAETLARPLFDIPDAHSVLAAHYLRLGDRAEALREIQIAVESAAPYSRERFVRILGGMETEFGRHSEAANHLASVVDLSVANPARDEYIQSLYRANRLAEALRVTRQIRSVEGAGGIASEIEAEILKQADDWVGAAEVWAVLSERHLDRPDYRIHAAVAALRAGDASAAHRLIIGVDIEGIRDSAEMLLDVAQLRAELGIGGSLPYAYRARRIQSDDPDVHARYCMICVSLREPEDSQGCTPPSTIQVGTAVDLEYGDKTVRLAILNDDPMFSGEIRPEDERAKRLLGKSVGDTVRLPAGILGEADFKVAGIVTKYVYMSHESINLFGQQTLTHESLAVADIANPRFADQLTDILDRKARNALSIFSAYRRDPVTIYMIADIMKRPVVEIWLGLTSSTTGRVKCTAGTRDDGVAQLQSLSSNRTAVLDEVALFSVVTLGLQDEIVKKFDRVVVPRCVVSGLKVYAQELQRENATGTMWSDGIRRYFAELPKEHNEKPKQLVNGCIAFAEAQLDIEPCLEVLERSPEERESMGIHALAAILLAKKESAILYSDDVVLKAVAQSEFHVCTISTPYLIEELNACDLITTNRKFKIQQQLILLNYYFIGINHEMLASVLEDSGFCVSETVKRVFSAISGPDCDTSLAVVAVSKLLKLTWGRMHSDLVRSSILDLCIESLIRGRQAPVEVLTSLARHVDTDFGTLIIHPHASQIKAMIYSWIRLHIV